MGVGMFRIFSNCAYYELDNVVLEFRIEVFDSNNSFLFVVIVHICMSSFNSF